MELDEKITEVYHLFFGDDGNDYDTSKKLDKILQYTIEEEARASNALNTTRRQGEAIKILVEENRNLEAENQRLQQELDVERAASITYSKNLWNILEGLGRCGTTVQFTLMKSKR